MLRKADYELEIAYALQLPSEAWSEETKKAFVNYCNVLKNYEKADINELRAYPERIDELVDILSPLSRQAMNVDFAITLLEDLNTERLNQQIEKYMTDEEYKLEVKKFETTIKNLNIQPLAEIAWSLYKGVDAAVEKPGITINDKVKLTNILNSANELINDLVVSKNNPWNVRPLTHFFEKLDNYQKAVNRISGMNRDTKRMIAGACLSLLGFAILAASVTVAVMTFGVATPLSVAAAAVSTKLMIAGALCVPAAAGLTLGVANGIFADRDRKGPLTCLAEDFSDEIRAIKSCKKWC